MEAKIIHARKTGKPNYFMPPRTMKLLLGGKWPKTTGFNYDSVREFRFEAGVWQPYGPWGEILPGPAIGIAAIEVDARGLVIGAAEKERKAK